MRPSASGIISSVVHGVKKVGQHCSRLPRSRTATAQHRAYASVDPLLWNDLPAITRAAILSGGITVSARSFKTFLFSRGSSHWKRLCYTVRGAL